MTVELLFREAQGPQPGGDFLLLFGGSGTPPVDPPDVDLPLGLLRSSCAAGWRTAERVAPSPQAAPWRASQHLSATWVSPWRAAGPLAHTVAVPHGSTATVRPAGVRLPWNPSSPVRPAGVRFPWRGAQALGQSWSTHWRGAEPAGHITRAPWGVGLRTAAPVAVPWGVGLHTSVPLLAPWARGTRMPGQVRAPWQAGIRLESIGGPWTPRPRGPVLVEPCYQPDPGNDFLLLFREALTGIAALVFACRIAALAVVPIRRVYMVTNVTSLTRVDGGALVPCYGMSLSLDVDSWAWGFSATLPATALDLIEPSVLGEPVELEAMINGIAFRLIAEGIGRERVFGNAGLRVTGRGKTAVLDAPFSPVVTFSEVNALTSQQLLDQAMPFGWSVDWGLTPWLVPGGVWSHQGTPASAAVAIALAGGGYVQPHASASSISVLPLYPSMPWTWAGVSPDIELPAAVTTREAIEWVDRPRYNGVYVTGTTVGGVLRLVKRAGTAGDILAPMVSDPLTTHSNAARQRGTAVLANTGRKAMLTLKLPVLPETGVIRPGKFVRYVDGATVRVGLVRSVTVDTAWPEVWQTIGVETHVG